MCFWEGFVFMLDEGEAEEDLEALLAAVSSLRLRLEQHPPARPPCHLLEHAEKLLSESVN